MYERPCSYGCGFKCEEDFVLVVVIWTYMYANVAILLVLVYVLMSLFFCGSNMC